MVPTLEPSLARTQLSRTLNTYKGIDCTGLICTLIIRNYDADKEPVYSGFDFGPYYGGTLNDAIQFQEIEIYDHQNWKT
jgi:hypothetical protein